MANLKGIVRTPKGATVEERKKILGKKLDEMLEVRVPPIWVQIKTASTSPTHYGDEVIVLPVPGCGRFDIANRLREIASLIAATDGPDILGGTIVVLMRHGEPGRG